MALITCPECQAQISDKAAACPRCGAPRDPVPQPAAPAMTLTDVGLNRPSPPPAGTNKSAPTWAWVVGVGLLGVFIIGLVAGNSGGPSRYELRRHLESVLKDVSSAQYRNETINPVSKHLCGEVNAKNSMGGYTGYKRFISGPAAVALEGESPVFATQWETLCEARND